MSELRQDPFSGRWVVIAQKRAERPQEFTQIETRRGASTCPFCFGNEAETPNAVACYRGTSPESPPRWQVRVVPNKFPAVEFAACNGEPASDPSPGFAAGRPASGTHEVIIESPDHVVSFSELTDEQAELSFQAYRDRLLALQANPELAYALVFKNARVGAGASLEHVHSQLIALPCIPPEVQFEQTRAAEHAALRGTSLMQSVLSDEVDGARRLVAVTDRFVAFCPAASRMPYETWVVPQQPAPSFELESPDMLNEAARLVRDVIMRIERVVQRPAYNYWLHSAPFRDDRGSIHWRIEIAPRLTRLAGFEIGSGCFINSVAPEVAAETLR